MKKDILKTGAAVAALVMAAPVWAQQTSDNRSGATSTGSDGTPIVVTAQRREQVLQEVPIAVSAFDSELRDQLGIRSIQDFTNFTPGLSYSTALDRISLRGIGRLTNTIGSDPGVATYNDGFYTSSTVEASKTPMFVERVEILRGPQGTLYGRNSVGGAINVISRRPNDFWEFEGRASADDNVGMIAEGFISGPLTDGFRIRLSGQYGPQGTRDIFDNASGRPGEGFLQRSLLEAQVEADLGDNVELWLKYSHAEWDDRFRSANLITPYDTTTLIASNALVPNAAFGFATANTGITMPRTINTNTISEQRLEDNHNIVANLTADLGGVELRYVGGYSTYLYTAYSDLDYTPRDLVVTNAGTFLGFYSYNPTYVQEYIEDKSYFSNELTLSSNDDGPLQWIVGLYQYHEEFYQPVTWFQDSTGVDTMGAAMVQPINAVLGGLADPNPRRAYYAGSGDLTIDSYAIFGQADFEVSPGLTLTAGLRYSYDDKEGFESFRLVNWNPAAPVAACFGGCGPFTPAIDVTTFVTGVGDGSGAVTRTLEDNWDGFSWRFAANYEFDDDYSIYGSYSRGLKSGGFNLGSFSASPIVDQEEVDAFEIGFRSQPAQGVVFNATGFYYIYRDAQVPLFVNQGGVSVQNFFNIDEIESYGIELETVISPVDWFELRANYSFLDSTFSQAGQLYDDDSSPGVNFVDITGNRVPQSSRHKVALSGLIHVPTSSGDFLFAASYFYRSNAFYNVFENPNARTPGFDQVDLRLTYSVPSRNMTFIAYVRNLFDDLGYDGAAATNGSTSTGFGSVTAFTPPRTIGAEIQFRF